MGSKLRKEEIIHKINEFNITLDDDTKWTNDKMIKKLGYVYLENDEHNSDSFGVNYVQSLETVQLCKHMKDEINNLINQNEIFLEIVTTKNDLKQHKQNTQYRQYRSRNLINQGTCPRCGGQLILRQAKYGCFYGCTNYPKCKFTLNCN